MGKIRLIHAAGNCRLQKFPLSKAFHLPVFIQYFLCHKLSPFLFRTGQRLYSYSFSSSASRSIIASSTFAVAQRLKENQEL